MNLKKRDIFLTALLLLLIGVLLGMIVSISNSRIWDNDLAEVNVTEITRSSQPVFSPGDLEGLDPRFLFQNIADGVMNTVVYIETTVQMRTMEEEHPEEGIWDRFLPRRARTVGSGVIISSDGYLLTNNHVIEHTVGDGIQVTLNDTRTYSARIVGADPSTDLAVLKIDAERLEPAVLGNSDHITIGEWVLAVGNPFRLRSTVTAGIVSALSRDVQIINDSMRIESFIQTDAAINQGNSGGALVNTSGELIGINTAIATQSGSYQGYGFAVPSNLALKVASDLIEFGEVRRGMMGVTIESVNQPIAKDLELEQIRGVMIIDVLTEGSAAEAGLETHDIILEVNGAEVNEANQLQEKVAMFRPGDQVELTIWRNGETLRKELYLREMEIPEPEILEFDEEPIHPEDFFGEPDDGDPNLESQNFPSGFSVIEQLNESTEIPEIVVTHVERESEAWNRGLRNQYKILSINDQPVQTLEELHREYDRVRQGGQVSLKIETPESDVGFVILER